jgi:RNA polymerase sigma-70 factor (ECF subfamily)
MDDTELNDTAFLARLRQGDERAFSLLFRATRDRIHNAILRMVGCPAEAQDLTQEVYLRAYKALSRFRGDSKITSWLYRIAVNQVRNRIKYHRSRMQRAHGQLDEERHGGTMPVSAALQRPDLKLDATHLEQFLVRALQAMDPIFREVIVLRDIEGLSYEEIRTATGIEMGTVKSRLNRGRRWLAERLAERDRGEPSPALEGGQDEELARRGTRPLLLAAFVWTQVRS